MSVERRISIGLEDIDEVRLKCLAEGCKERVPVLTELGRLSARCRNGHEWKLTPEAKLHPEKSQLCNFLLALAQPEELLKEARNAGFEVRLESTDPLIERD